MGGYSSGNSDAYFGDLTADISEAVSLERFYGGSILKMSDITHTSEI
ncbi:MAG: hypothetical protein ACLUKN_17095 [Bacilli bacterium]